MRLVPSTCLVGIALSGAACSSSSTEPAAPPTFAIVTVTGGPLTAVAGDGVALKVVQKFADGSTVDLPSGATVTWMNPTTVTALSPESTASSPIPMPTAQPTAGFIENPGRPDHAMDLSGVLFVFDPGTPGGGTVPILAHVSGPDLTGQATESLTIAATPIGDPTRGSALYGVSGAGCAMCHGSTGAGSTPPTGPSMDYVIAGSSYPFPAPGLNAMAGNAAGDPAWNSALFAMGSRADMDNGGLTLRLPMPDWLTEPNPSTGKLPTT